jgi:hypothetical protein
MDGGAKRIYRLYDLEGLAVRTKPRKKLVRRARVPAIAPTRPNERLTCLFSSDHSLLENGTGRLAD